MVSMTTLAQDVDGSDEALARNTVSAYYDAVRTALASLASWREPA